MMTAVPRCALLCGGRPFAPRPEGLQAAGLQEAGKRPPGSPRGRRPRAASSYSCSMALCLCPGLCLGVSPCSAMPRAGRLPLALTAAAAAALLAAAALAAPASLLDAPSDAAAPQDCDKEETVYDQRQNGSENYRVHVDGVVVAVVPAEVLVPLVMGAGGEDLEHQLEELLAGAAAASASASGGGGSYKPEAGHTKPPARPTPAPSTPQPTTAADTKQPAVAADKPNKGKLRLSHLLMPLLRRL